MKKSVIIRVLALLLLILVVVFTWFFIPSNRTSSLNSNLTDTAAIKDLLLLGDKLRGSNQDSCHVAYNKAIALAKTLDQNKLSNHLLGLGYVGIAAVNCNMGNYEESLKSLQLALKSSEKFSDNDIRAQAINVKGLLFFNQSNFDSAVVCFNEALSLAKLVNNKKLQAKIHTNFAIIQFYKGLCDEAISYFSKTLELAEELNDFDLLTGTYINMGLVANNFGEYNKAIGFYQKAIDNYQKINGIDGLILCYQNLGSLHVSLGNYGQAVDYMQTSLKLAEQIGDKSNIAKAHHNMAEIFSRVGDNEQAMNEYLISIKKKEELNDKTALTDGYNGIGGIFYQKGQYEKAFEYFEKALKTSLELSFVKGQQTAFSSMASVYLAQENYTSAAEFYQKALDLAQQTMNVSSESDLFINLGNVFSHLKQFRKAENYLKNALAIKKELGEKDGLANVYSELAQLKLQEANASRDDRDRLLENAREYGLKAHRIGEEIQSTPLVNSTSLLLKRIFKGLGNTSKALEFAEKFIVTNDSLQNKSKSEAITFAEARWSVQKHQDKIETLENEKELLDKIVESERVQTKQYRIISAFAVAIVFLLIAFSIFLFYYFQKKRDAIYQQQMHNLTVLKMQNVRSRISPHFIFNVLSSISQSVNDADRLKNKINSLSVLLRNVIENIEVQSISFDKELLVVQAFVELQKEMIPAPFTFKVEIDQSFDHEILIPAMIIQIPVENAIKHGLMPKENGPSEVIIRANKTTEGAMIAVLDNGLGLSNLVNKTAGTGTGLKMVMQSIQFLNSKNVRKMRFSINDRSITEPDQPGTVAEIFIPNEFSFIV